MPLKSSTVMVLLLMFTLFFIIGTVYDIFVVGEIADDDIPSKIARKSPICPTPVYLTSPLKGFPLELVTAQGSEETGMMGLPGGRKSFKIGLAVLIQYRRVMDRHPATQPATSQ